MGDPNQMMNQQVMLRTIECPSIFEPRSGNNAAENDDDGHGASDGHDGHHHLLLQVLLLHLTLSLLL
jgi:hypothetical protein